jgi:hypothetical protein
MRASRARLGRIRLGLVLAIAVVAGLPRAADATTVATFEWISTGSVGGTVTPTGTLVLSLPDTIATQTFNTGNIGVAAASPMLTAFSYRFGDGTLIGLADISPTSSIYATSWYSSSTNVAVGAPGGSVYLLSQFILRGLAGSPVQNFFEISNAAGQQNGQAGPSIVGASSNRLFSNDAGYWRMGSFVTATVVPVPAALPLLLSGLVAFGGLARRGGFLRVEPAEKVTGLKPRND